MDNSDENHPVIRLVNANFSSSSSSTSTGVSALVGETAESIALSGNIEFSGDTYSGLRFNSEVDDGTNKMTIDIIGREEGEQFASREVSMNDETIAKVLASTDFEIEQKSIAAGKGITVSESGNTITIAASGSSSTSGFTGTRNVVVDVDYNGHYLRKKFATETWKDGVLTASTTGAWETYHTAVEETV